MSYVIQNFYEINKKVTTTPRYKFLFIMNNLNKFLIFIKLNTFLYSTNKLNIFNLNFFFLFYKSFFSKQYFKLFNQINLSLVSNYTNNLLKSFIYNIFFSIFNFFKFKKIKNVNLQFNTSFLFNIYFFPIKVLNIKINNLFYKNIFFYFLLINPFI